MKALGLGALAGVGIAAIFLTQAHPIESNPVVNFTVDSIAIDTSGETPNLTNLFNLQSCDPGYRNVCYIGVKSQDGTTKHFAVGGDSSEIFKPSDDIVKGGQYMAYKDGIRLMGLKRVGGKL